MARLVDKAYGQALFDLSLEENKIEENAEYINVVKAAFMLNPEILTLLTHPRIPKEEKLDVVINSFSNFVSDDILGFMVTVVKAGRQGQLMSIFDYFIDAVKAYKRIGRAYVTSAIELTKAQKEAVKKRLLEITDNIEYEMNYSVNKSLIGGMVIRIGDKVVDSSIKTKLETISRDLMKIQVKEGRC